MSENKEIKESIQAFVRTLREMFMIDDAAELDFGIYRIMAQKKAEIEAFFGLNDESDGNALCRKIESILAEQQGASVDVAEIKKQLENRIQTYREDGESMEQINKKPKIIELRQQLENVGDPAVMVPRVLTDLNDFFGRYYDNGDFISERRYVNGDKDNTYLVPYNGEEVKLHWANADQYYIKTSEAFKNYRFKLKNGKEVEFTLKNAVQLKNNEKEQKEWARKFKLWDGVSEPGEEPAPDFVPVKMEDDGVLHIYFTYELMKKKGNDQRTINNAIYETLATIISKQYADDYQDLLLKPIGGDTEELRRHINRYTAKNSSDYFIHKNLGGFLRRELDYFLKNEVMQISDLDYNNLRRTLAEAKTIKAVGEEIIQMLAGLEEFQKKLWLKKKFVVQTDYCITLDRVPESLYDEICANDKQREEWIRLFAIDKIKGDPLNFTHAYSEPLTVGFLKDEQNKYLVLDTAFFSDNFKHKLLESIDNIDEKFNGLLINSENFQALELLREKYAGEVKCVYVDPPYNTGDDDFAYKDNYQESSWLTCIDNRIELTTPYYAENGSFAASIDINEVDHLTQLLDKSIGKENRKANITVRRASITGAKVINPGPVNISENVLLYANGNNKWKPENAYRERVGGYDDRYGNIILNPNESYEKWQFGTVLDEFAKAKGVAKNRLSNVLGENYAEELLKFAIENGDRIVQFATLDDNSVGADAAELKQKSLAEPEKIFYLKRKDANDYYVIKGKVILFYKDRLRWMGDGVVPVEKVSDIWDDVLPNDLHNEGGVALKKGKKPEKLVNRIFESTTVKGELIMDYFAGSATSGAVALKSGRKFINVEANDYFDEIPLRRLKNTLNGDKSGVTNLYQWKGGGMIKYIRLEQYEDTLNNLYRDPKKGAWYEEKIGADTIGYVMDMQSQQNWMHTDWMGNPFDVKMQITRGNEKKEQTVDVVETFNYLIGLNVEKMQWPLEGMQVVTGVTHKGKRTMVIWRNTAEVTDEQMKAFIDSVGYKQFKQIYLNGETTLGTMLDGKLQQIETEFEHRMFAQD